jgi:hypothetical protein
MACHRRSEAPRAAQPPDRPCQDARPAPIRLMTKVSALTSLTSRFHHASLTVTCRMFRTACWKK